MSQPEVITDAHALEDLREGLAALVKDSQAAEELKVCLKAMGTHESHIYWVALILLMSTLHAAYSLVVFFGQRRMNRSFGLLHGACSRIAEILEFQIQSAVSVRLPNGVTIEHQKDLDEANPFPGSSETVPQPASIYPKLPDLEKGE